MEAHIIRSVNTSRLSIWSTEGVFPHVLMGTPKGLAITEIRTRKFEIEVPRIRWVSGMTEPSRVLRALGEALRNVGDAFQYVLSDGDELRIVIYDPIWYSEREWVFQFGAITTPGSSRPLTPFPGDVGSSSFYLYLDQQDAHTACQMMMASLFPGGCFQNPLKSLYKL